ncbi:MAG: adenylate kinase [Steroidobacteraceae bacterium]
MHIVLLGPPGSGKGTQSQLLIERFGVPQISTGDLLRSAVARRTPVGLKAEAIMAEGKLVDDATILALVRDRLAEPDAARGFILDGFPRNIVQAEALNGLLAEIGKPIDAVLLFEVDSEQLIRRLSGRRSCATCGRVFNIHFAPPGTPPHCERCNDRPELITRPDDNEQTVRRRLSVYDTQTRPLVDYYAARGLLRRIDADAAVETVTSRVLSAIGTD